MGNKYTDTEVLQENHSLLYEQLLQRNQYLLSISMSSCLIEKIYSLLSDKKTITTYEGQLISSQLTDMQKASRLIHTLLRKGRRACQQFYQALECFDPLLYEDIVGLPAARPPAVDRSCASQHIILPGAQRCKCTSLSSSGPSAGAHGMGTTYVVNIQNSTLNSCIIGSHNSQHIGMNHQNPLPQNTGRTPHEEEAESGCECGQQGEAEAALPPANVQIHRSNLQYVNIGDMNRITIEEEDDDEEEEEEENTEPKE